MQIKLITTILFTCVLGACQPQATTENSKNNAASSTSTAKPAVAGDMTSVKKNIQAALEQAYPEQKVQIKSVEASPVAGLYEVVVFPNQVVYMDGSGDYMFVGNLLDVKKKVNLTEEKTADLNRIDYKALPFDSAIKEVRGNGQYKVAVFSDPDCPFCKKLEHEIAQMTDVTIYTFLMPIDSLHPQATEKSIQLWCQPNRTEAWTKWIRDGVAPAQVPVCDNPVEKLAKLSESFGFNGTPTIVYPNGKIQSGYMPKADFEAALKQNQS
ncbi:DsbC family protein [Vitreoscilla massiliensis]